MYPFPKCTFWDGWCCNLASDHRKGKVGVSLFFKGVEFWPIAQLAFLSSPSISNSPPPPHFTRKSGQQCIFERIEASGEPECIKLCCNKVFSVDRGKAESGKRKKRFSFCSEALFAFGCWTCQAFEFHVNVVCLYLKVWINFNMEFILLCKWSEFR